MGKHRVGVVVFCDANGVDELDASHAARIAVRQTLIGTVVGTFPHRVAGKRGEDQWLITVHDVMEVGAAAGNGYLWTQVTDRAFRRAEEARPDA